MQVRNDILFHSLHADGLLMLANCWDAGSARIAQAAGARALATSSAAVAWSHGFADGSTLPRALLMASVEGILRASALPLTVDAEDGYSDDPAQAAALAGELIDAGVVGINIEDGAGTPALLADKIGAIRALADARGVKLFINARTDVYLRGVEPGARVEETIRRAALYQEAGASGLFVPAMVAEDDIAAVIKATRLPLNVMVRDGVPPLARLLQLGVRRLSAGSAISEATFGCIDALTRQFLDSGTVNQAGFPRMGYGALNSLMG
ncbi:isocitrate lyase/phosphoenolpyruvate mutase family protein [Massilia violaceinigra]|uniref:Isocitrate lyase/phosphoenolpyruvate mutase family protein n=1 Tax=Massilia violaceinigra TaxID=2045208 RepID=A0ABY4ACQ3_9BURK|nr:isocitrate lyase/phosphoenolpyruvate mutase family protein [Massilia violaceinigra]UOD30368.1 isocitrate lyase/phosphoenolpyruvate mutase family protein [Massilia violaceinigra]